MSLVDQYSNPVTSSRKLVHASDTSRLRGPQFVIQNKSIEDLITERDRDVLVSLSQKLYYNLGPMRAVVGQKKSHSVGAAWLPTYEGDDREHAGEIKSWLIEDFFNNLDVRGGQWDWHENLESVSEEIDVRGDHFTLLTTSEDGTKPRIQNIPAYSVRTKGETRKNDRKKWVAITGPWKNNKIVHGIIYNDYDRALAYRVSTGDAATDFVDIPAASVIHSFDPSMSDGKRGLPVATHALEDLKHVLQSTEYESTRQLILSSVGLLVENSTGGPQTGDMRSMLQGTASDIGGGVQAREITPSIWYAQAGANESVTQLKNDAGGDTFDSFHDRLIRSFVVGSKWSYSLAWKHTGNGTAERSEIIQARNAVIDRQKRLSRWARRVITYGYSFRASRGELPQLDKPMMWGFTKPPRLTVDDGREEKMMNDSFRLGRRNMTELLEADGKTYDMHLDVRADEAKKRKQIIQRIYETDGILIDERELVMLTPNETASETTTTSETTTENE